MWRSIGRRDPYLIRQKKKAELQKIDVEKKGVHAVGGAGISIKLFVLNYLEGGRLERDQTTIKNLKKGINQRTTIEDESTRK